MVWIFLPILLIFLLLVYLFRRRLDLVWAWRRLYRASPRLTLKSRIVLGTPPLGWGHRGHSWCDDTSAVYAREVTSTGDLMSTMLHEWAHHTCRSGSHGRRFRSALVQWGYRAGVRDLDIHGDLETQISTALDQRHRAASTPRCCWRRG